MQSDSCVLVERLVVLFVNEDFFTKHLGVRGSATTPRLAVTLTAQR